jgi:hypothetical protein
MKRCRDDTDKRLLNIWLLLKAALVVSQSVAVSSKDKGSRILVGNKPFNLQHMASHRHPKGQCGPKNGYLPGSSLFNFEK